MSVIHVRIDHGLFYDQILTSWGKSVTQTVLEIKRPQSMRQDGYANDKAGYFSGAVSVTNSIYEALISS
jgi:hypothetical protein